MDVEYWASILNVRLHVTGVRGGDAALRQSQQGSPRLGRRNPESERPLFKPYSFHLNRFGERKQPREADLSAYI